MSALAAHDLYERGLDGDALFVRREDGSLHTLPVASWLGPLSDADHAALARTQAPVLDVGCGPGRHVSALARRGVLALGVDVAPAAVRHARRRGAPAVEGSVFDSVPGAGRWGSALLLDGNVGIGGRPDALLRRVRALLSPGGRVICELDPPGSPTVRELVRLENADAICSGWFAWARVGSDALAPIAAAAGMSIAEQWRQEDRWFAVLSVG
jgi:SAM-dependent methyltransferase